MHVLNCNIMYVTVIGLDVSIQFNALLAAGIGPFIHLCAYYMICVIGEVIRQVDVDCMLTTGKTSLLFWMENHCLSLALGLIGSLQLAFYVRCKTCESKSCTGKRQTKGIFNFNGN